MAGIEQRQVPVVLGRCSGEGPVCRRIPGLRPLDQPHLDAVGAIAAFQQMLRCRLIPVPCLGVGSARYGGLRFHCWSRSGPGAGSTRHRRKRRCGSHRSGSGHRTPGARRPVWSPVLPGRIAPYGCGRTIPAPHFGRSHPQCRADCGRSPEAACGRAVFPPGRRLGLPRISSRPAIIKASVSIHASTRRWIPAASKNARISRQAELGS